MREKIDYRNYEKPTDYMKMRAGDNVVRIISDGFLIKRHQFRTAGRFVSIDCVGEGCQQCKNNVEIKTRYAWIVIDRVSQKVKFMEVGTLVGDAICNIGKREDLKQVDIQITRRGEGRETSYTINKLEEPTQLTDEERAEARAKIDILRNKYLAG